MSDVEKYWEAVRGKWPSSLPDFNKLPLQEQMMVIQSINLLLQVLNNHNEP